MTTNKLRKKLSSSNTDVRQRFKQERSARNEVSARLDS